MTDTKWLIGLAIIFCCLTIAAQIMQGLYYQDANITTFGTAIDNIRGIDTKDFGGLVISFFTGIWSFVCAIGNMFTWNYSFLTGDLEILKWILFIPATAILFLSLAISVKNSA